MDQDQAAGRGPWRRKGTRARARRGETVGNIGCIWLWGGVGQKKDEMGRDTDGSFRCRCQEAVTCMSSTYPLLVGSGPDPALSAPLLCRAPPYLSF